MKAFPGDIQATLNECVGSINTLESQFAMLEKGQSETNEYVATVVESLQKQLGELQQSVMQIASKIK
jgi:hypothetical protein